MVLSCDLLCLPQDSNAPPRSDVPTPPVLSALRPSRVISSTSEEEEALTEKFLKINCKYITDGKVSQYSPFGEGLSIVALSLLVEERRVNLRMVINETAESGIYWFC